MGPISCPQTSVTIYQYTLSNIPEDQRSQKQTVFRGTQHKCRTTGSQLISFNLLQLTKATWQVLVMFRCERRETLAPLMWRVVICIRKYGTV